MIGKNGKKILGGLTGETENMSILHNKFKLMNMCSRAYVKNNKGQTIMAIHKGAISDGVPTEIRGRRDKEKIKYIYSAISASWTFLCENSSAFNK